MGSDTDIRVDIGVNTMELIKVKRTNPEYKEVRDRHYVPNHGCIGRQVHYNVLEDNKMLGIISGASAI